MAAPPTLQQYHPHTSNNEPSNLFLSSSLQPARRLSIFDIPLIVDEIFGSLSLADLRNCHRVNKQWRDLCLQGLWRFVFLHRQPFRSGGAQGPSVSDTQRESILQNAHRIRTLNIDFWDTILVDGEPCRGLRELTIWGQDQERRQQQTTSNATGRYSSAIAPSKSTATAWDLLASNTVLKSLSLEYTERLLPHLTAIHLNSVLFSSLHVLNIDFGVCVSSSHALKTLLCHCPDTLQELSLTHIGANFWIPPTDVSCPATAPDITWRALRSLRSLRIQCQVIENLTDAILLPMLKHSCPQLKQLTVGIMPRPLYPVFVETLIASCPRITYLEIPELDLSHGEMLQLVQSYVGLQQVHIGVYPDMLDQVIPTLIRLSGSTLTRIQILEREIRTTSKPFYPVLFLQHCPRLVSLKVQTDCWYLGLVNCLRTLVESNSDNGEWASPVLDTLDLRCLYDLDATTIGKKPRIITLTEQLCRKLRDQPRLKSIRLSRTIAALKLPIGKEGEDATARQAIADKREGMIREYLYQSMTL